MSAAVRNTVCDPPRRGRLTRIRDAYLRRAPGLIATIALVLGLATLAEAFLPHERHRVKVIAQIVPVPATAAATAIVAVSGLLLLQIATGLRKRKRRAWRAGVAITALTTLARLFREEPRPVEGAISLALLVLLLAARSRFVAKADPRTRWFAVVIFLQFFAVAVIYGLGLLYFSGQTVGHPPFSARLQEVLYSMVGARAHVVFRAERFADIFYWTLFIFGLVTVVVVALLALRPSEPIARLSLGDEERLRDLLAKQGERDSLGYFALRRDKSVIWSPTGKAAITYRVVQGVALASGDPLGDPEAWPGAMAEYLRLAEEYAWTPAVIGCSEQGATVYKRECDLSAIALGDEAIIDVEDFTLEGRAMRGVRQACTRVTRAGFDVRVRRARDIDSAEFAELGRLAEAWRGDAAERGYSMALSRIGDPADGDCVIATACQDSQLRGLLHFVPWGPDGLSLDLMRRDRAADNGLNECMIASLVDQCPALGVRRVSLNFAVFREALERGEKIGAGPILRVWRAVIVFVSRWWQIESLYRFNVKFRPYWEPRFLSYPSARDLPRIAIAALEAEAFVVRPRRLKRMLGRV